MKLVLTYAKSTRLCRSVHYAKEIQTFTMGIYICTPFVTSCTPTSESLRSHIQSVRFKQTSIFVCQIGPKAGK